MNRLALSIAAILLLILFLLSGCAQIPLGSESDAVVAIVNGVKITDQQVYTRINFYISQQNLTQEEVKQDPEIWSRLKSDVLKELEGNVIAMSEAVKSGLDKLSPAEEDELNKAINLRIDSLKSTIRKDVEAKAYVEGNTNMDNEISKQYEAFLKNLGYTEDSYKKQIRDDYIINKVKSNYTKDITVTDEEIRKNYNSNVEQQKKAIQNSPETIESYLSFNSPIYYYPAGYKYVRHILIKLPSEVIGQAAILQTQGKLSDLQELIEPELEKINPKAQEVLDKLNSGERFDKLIDSYNEDEIMKADPLKTEGYLVGPYARNTIQEYIRALSTLQNPGDHTGLIPTFMGYYIIECVKPIPEGPVPYDQLQTLIKQQILQYKQAKHWEDVKNGWLDELKKAGKLEEYPDLLK